MGWRAAGARSRAALLLFLLLGLMACDVPDPGPGDVLPAGYVAPPAHEVLVGVPYGPHPEQLLDVHLPPPGQQPAPVVVWLHSGGWIAGSRSDVPEVLLRQVDRAGWAVVSADYRLARLVEDRLVGTFPAASQDVDRLIRYLRSEGPALGLDADRIVLGGGSAGGHLAALAANAPGLHVDPTLPASLVAQRVDVDALFVGAAPLDLAAMSVGTEPVNDLVRYYVCGIDQACTPDLLRSASPIAHLRSTSPPAYVVAGLLDDIVDPTVNATPYVALLESLRSVRDAEVGAPSAWADLVEDHGHDVPESAINVTAFERWLDEVGRGRWAPVSSAMAP